jgi:hypothetical protein
MTLAATWLRLKTDFANETLPFSSRGSKEPTKATKAASVGRKIIPAAKVTGKRHADAHGTPHANWNKVDSSHNGCPQAKFDELGIISCETKSSRGGHHCC